ncbi:hypothetical protein Tco_0238559 [Tanacetum coccineum]
MVMCNCWKIAKIKTTWTDRNPGRRFYYCDNLVSYSYQLNQSVDVIHGLLRARNQLNEDLEEKYMLLKEKEKLVHALVGAGGGEVKGGGVDFGVSRTLLGEIPGDIMGESGSETFGVDGGAD